MNVFAPVAAIFLYGYMYNAKPWGGNTFNGVCLYSIIRAVLGLGIGAVSYNLSRYLSKNVKTTVAKVLMTIFELLLYVTFFVSIFRYCNDTYIMYCIMILLPVAVAITFSGTSYVALIFRFRWMRYFASWSLAIYLTHNTAKRIAVTIFSSYSFETKVIVMIVATILLSIAYFLLDKAIHLIWNYKLKSFFVLDR